MFITWSESLIALRIGFMQVNNLLVVLRILLHAEIADLSQQLLKKLGIVVKSKEGFS